MNRRKRLAKNGLVSLVCGAGLLGGLPAASAAGSGATAADPYRWSRSLPVNFESPATGALGGTEARQLTAFDGRLFAAIGYWRDTQTQDPALPGGQVLVLDAPNAAWRVDLQLDELAREGGGAGAKRFIAIGALAAFEARQDSAGHPLAKPVPFLVASVWDRVGGLRLFARGVGLKAPWNTVDLTADAPRASQVRSFGMHEDAVTKRQLFFAGTSPNGVYAGTYDGGPAFVHWDQQPERWESEHGGGGQARIMAFAECNGNLYATSGFSLFQRLDGPNPSWRIIYSYDAPSSNPRVSGFRGLRAIPAPGGGEQLLLTVENNPCRILRIDPRSANAPGGAHYDIDLDLSSFLTQKWGTKVAYGIAAYNDACSVRLPGTSADSLLIGFESRTPQDAASAATDHKHPWAHYLVRSSDPAGLPRYEVHRIDDPKYPNLPLISTRTIVRSPFSQDPAGTVYAGGFDAGNLTVHNTAWIYKGTPTN